MIVFGAAVLAAGLVRPRSITRFSAPGGGTRSFTGHTPPSLGPAMAAVVSFGVVIAKLVLVGTAAAY